jgi:tetratricopeptide (TPR) repeat protein
MASKESGAALVVVVWLYDWLLGAADGRRRRVAIHAALALVLVTGAVYRLRTLYSAEMTGLERDLIVQWRTQAVVFWRYVRLLVLPYGQSLIHPAQSIVHPVDPRVLAALAALVAAAVVGWRARARYPLAVLGGCWFVAALAPSSLVPLHELMSEHRLYLGAAGLAIAVASGWALWQARWQWRPWARVAFTAATLALFSLTVARNRVWADEVGLWGDAAAKAPLTWMPNYAFAEALRRRDGCAAALPAYRRALELDPRSGSTLTNLGTCLAALRRYSDAEPLLERALALEPRSPNLLNNLGQLARLTGRPEVARRRFAGALEIDPRHVPTRLSLAALEESSGHRAEALRLCREAAELAPEMPEPRNCLARLQGG